MKLYLSLIIRISSTKVTSVISLLGYFWDRLTLQRNKKITGCKSEFLFLFVRIYAHGKETDMICFLIRQIYIYILQTNIYSTKSLSVENHLYP